MELADSLRNAAQQRALLQQRQLALLHLIQRLIASQHLGNQYRLLTFLYAALPEKNHIGRCDTVRLQESYGMKLRCKSRLTLNRMPQSARGVVQLFFYKQGYRFTFKYHLYTTHTAPAPAVLVGRIDPLNGEVPYLVECCKLLLLQCSLPA